MATEPTRRLFTIHDYHRMVESGILDEDDRVELLDGEIVQMTAVGARHAAAVKGLNQILGERLGGRAIIGVQDPVILDDLSEPEPDLSICAPDDRLYAAGHPRPADVYFLIEVADATLRYDRQRKIPRYAAVGVSETWLVDLQQNVIEVCRAPGADGYTERIICGIGETMSPSMFPDVTIAVDDVLR
jgi:Uma2 family endonuclease